MPESVVPLIAVGVVIVLFIVLLSVLTNYYSLNGIKSKTVVRSARNCAMGDHTGGQKDICKRAV